MIPGWVVWLGILVLSVLCIELTTPSRCQGCKKALAGRFDRELNAVVRYEADGRVAQYHRHCAPKVL